MEGLLNIFTNNIYFTHIIPIYTFNERRIIMEKKVHFKLHKLKTLGNYCSDRTHFRIEFCRP